MSDQSENRDKERSLLPLAIGALGVVYGDIGTSPLYALRECFTHSEHMDPTPANIFGILSLIFWSLVLVISVKYMYFILRAENRGEGGILALMALASSGNDKRYRWLTLPLGLFGAALLYGDGAITPAVTVLSAVEGIKVLTPVFSEFVVPLTCLIIVALFLVQKYGTGQIGSVFGPIIAIWFIAIGCLGIHGMIGNPEVLRAVNPVHAAKFIYSGGWTAALVLGSVFLVVTGGEALYADMGHFGKKPIRLAWFVLALPCLTLNYFGQGALLLNDPSAISNPFYLLAPNWFLLPLVLLATAASVIASQALISGVFSLTRQAVSLGFAPRVGIIHTSRKEIGQIYVPFVNYLLMCAVIWLVLSFQTSSALAGAYGVAVTMTMVITTILACFVARNLWNWSFGSIIVFLVLFLTIDLAFFMTNIVKVFHGGWVPLVMGAGIYIVMSTWQTGRKILSERLKLRSVSLDEFVNRLHTTPPPRVKGSAIYMTGDPWGVPVPLLHSLKHNKVLHERVVILTIVTRELPTVDKSDRILIERIDDNFFRIIASYGFMETPMIREILDKSKEKGLEFVLEDTTFVLGRETILATGHPGMAIWREKLFAFMARNAQRPTTFFQIPAEQVIEVGIQVEI